MKFGFRRLVNPGCHVGEVDLDATRHERKQVHEQVRLREHLLTLLSSAPIDERLVRVTPYEVLDGGSGDHLKSAS